MTRSSFHCPLPALRFALAFLVLVSVFSTGASAQDSTWSQSIVTLEVTRKQFDYFQPWSQRTARLIKTGLVVKGRQILTTADSLSDSTLIRVQRNGRGRWWIGRIDWIDYPANLALLSVSEEAFWPDLQPVEIGGTASDRVPLQIIRWREGNLERRTAEFTQHTVKSGELASINHVQLELNSDISGVGRGEPVVNGGKVVGLLTAQAGRSCTALPASFVSSILEAHRNDSFPGLGYLHFYWQPGENPTTLRELGLEGEPRGVIVHYNPDRVDGLSNVLQYGDIILEMDGFKVDMEGDYQDPEFGLLMIENMAARGKWAGEVLPITICREGQIMTVDYKLPKFTYDHSLVPHANFDVEPEYLMVGGLVFQPLTGDYLRNWGADWERRAPFRLVYYKEQPVSAERPSLVLLSQVLPDEFNIGYQTLKYLVLDKVNGRQISRLTDLRDALANPDGGYHLIEFMKGEGVERIVLAAGESESAATARVLQNYSIDKPAFIAPEE